MQQYDASYPSRGGMGGFDPQGAAGPPLTSSGPKRSTSQFPIYVSVSQGKTNFSAFLMLLKNHTLAKEGRSNQLKVASWIELSQPANKN